MVVCGLMIVLSGLVLSCLVAVAVLPCGCLVTIIVQKSNNKFRGSRCSFVFFVCVFVPNCVIIVLSPHYDLWLFCLVLSSPWLSSLVSWLFCLVLWCSCLVLFLCVCCLVVVWWLSYLVLWLSCHVLRLSCLALWLSCCCLVLSCR